jgi:hypothetical protein
MKAVHEWISAAEIKGGKIFRSMRAIGAVWGERVTENGVWYAVKECAKRERQTPGTRSAENVCTALPFNRRRIGTNPVFVRSHSSANGSLAEL